jgi:Zn-dependent protease with chaperone function
MQIQACLRTILFIVTAAFVLGANSQILYGQNRDQNRRDQAKEDRILAELAYVAPSMVETFKAGTAALDSGNFAEAAKLYNQVHQKAAAWDVINRRLGTTLIRTGEKEEGLALLHQAVELKRSPENLISLAYAVAYPVEDKTGTLQELSKALPLAKEAAVKNTDKQDSSYCAILARIAFELKDEHTLRFATGMMKRDYPNTVEAHYLGAVVAAIDHEWITSEKEIKLAGELGYPAEGVEQFLASGIRSKALHWKIGYAAAAVFGVWAAGLVLLFVIGSILSRRTMKFLEDGDPDALTGERHQSLRAVYRSVVNIAGIYYFVSIPLVIALLLGITVLLVNAAITGQHISKFSIFMVIASVVSIFQMVRSLFLKPAPESSRRLITESEEPQLWAMVRDVAKTVGTRPVTEIQVTPGTDVAVYERGTLRQKLKDEAERVLILGLGVLDGFGQEEFRAVLAHEYGHFAHRDTAGGDMALRVNNSIVVSLIGIVNARQNSWINLGFHFLRIYIKIFNRISLGASRLQEAMADRLSAIHYGPASFEKGLRHVVRRQVEFDHFASKEIESALGERRAINLYSSGEGSASEHNPELEREINDAMTCATSEHDSHPSPIDRFRFISKVQSSARPQLTGNVWDLFQNRERLVDEMNELVTQRAQSAY